MDEAAILEEQKLFDEMPEIETELVVEEDVKGCLADKYPSNFFLNSQSIKRLFWVTSLCRDMKVKLITNETLKAENYDLDDDSEDYVNFEDQRCEIGVPKTKMEQEGLSEMVRRKVKVADRHITLEGNAVTFFCIILKLNPWLT